MSEISNHSPYAFVATERGLYELRLNIGFDENGYVVIHCGDKEEPMVSITMAPGAAVKVAHGLMLCVAHAGAEIVGQLDGDDPGDEGVEERTH